MDTASRKLLFLGIGAGNSDPKVIGRWYFECRKIPSIIWLDKGTEKGLLGTIHACLRDKHGDMDAVDTVIFGKSTSNQIERWWRELYERLEKYYKIHLAFLKDQGHHDADMDIDRWMLAYIFHPILQNELDTFKDTIWNTRRIRH